MSRRFLALFAALVVHVVGCASAPAKIHPRAVEFQAAGAASLARGDLDGAAGQFALALEFEPNMAEARNGLGLVALSRGDHHLAEREFKAALALNEDLAEAHLNLGHLVLARGELDEALEQFRQALAIDPGYGAARLAAGQALLRLGRHEEARWELTKLCAIEPERASARAALALVLARMGRIAGAEAEAQRALALDPELPAAHRARAEILRRRGDLTGALEATRRVLAKEPSSIEDRLALATGLVATGDVESAINHLDGLERAAPRAAEIPFARAFAELRRERYSAAIAAARRALRIRPHFPEARLVLAESLIGAGDGATGRRELERFAAEAPERMAVERAVAEGFLRARGDAGAEAARGGGVRASQEHRGCDISVRARPRQVTRPPPNLVKSLIQDLGAFLECSSAQEGTVVGDG